MLTCKSLRDFYDRVIDLGGLGYVLASSAHVMDKRQDRLCAVKRMHLVDYFSIYRRI